MVRSLRSTHAFDSLDETSENFEGFREYYEKHSKEGEYSTYSDDWVESLEQFLNETHSDTDFVFERICDTSLIVYELY